MAGPASGNVQKVPSEETGEIATNPSVKLTSAQLHVKEQDIVSREELVKVLYDRTQQNQLELQTLASQLVQERAGYLAELASKEDEVQALRQEQARLKEHLQSVKLRAASVEPIVIMAKDAEEEITILWRHIFEQEAQMLRFEKTIMDRLRGDLGNESKSPAQVLLLNWKEVTPGQRQRNLLLAFTIRSVLAGGCKISLFQTRLPQLFATQAVNLPYILPFIQTFFTFLNHAGRQLRQLFATQVFYLNLEFFVFFRAAE
ncbi:hypothetical protein BDN71DRAFT_1431204 [Pleurotus eryngii]|uniref:Uncharacterized protein n=1 Tax=Pleurotus eryngii TaxID=5323 RepID=A0A9P5ZYP4_PLEER|nr:hypothetical protein BDN71DRAFT_1431204 [Pleurotus eryngii]